MEQLSSKIVEGGYLARIHRHPLGLALIESLLFATRATTRTIRAILRIEEEVENAKYGFSIIYDANSLRARTDLFDIEREELLFSLLSTILDTSKVYTTHTENAYQLLAELTENRAHPHVIVKVLLTVDL